MCASYIKRQKQKRKNLRMKEEETKIPPINQTITTYNRFRWRVNAAVTGTSISLRNVFDSCTVASAATTGLVLWSHIRIKRAHVWVPPTDATGANFSQGSAYFEWLTINDNSNFGLGARSNKMEIATAGLNPGHLVTRPPKGSILAMWMNPGNPAGTQFVMKLSLPIGSIIDLEFCSQIWDVGASIATENALVGATAGRIYRRGLDGLATASSAFTVLGWDTSAVQ